MQENVFALRSVETHKDDTNEDREYSDLSIARESATITCVWKIQRQIEWENFTVEKGKVSGML